ncbi:hypothetical protein WMF27_22790 [Sorangium sp. So ce281]|uniref:hypothetical protein n=1 Tax=unclassified Sorangium TaxID=2621164 RepID=UPI003F641E41
MRDVERVKRQRRRCHPSDAEMTSAEERDFERGQLHKLGIDRVFQTPFNHLETGDRTVHVKGIWLRPRIDLFVVGKLHSMSRHARSPPREDAVRSVI